MGIVFVNYGMIDKLILNNWYSDQHYYKLSYEGVPVGTYFEKGYVLLCSISSRLGLSYLQFKIAFFIAAAVLVYFSIGGYEISYVPVLLLYFFSSFQADLEQTRNFIAMSVVIFALRYLPEERRCLKNAILYILLIMLASTIHTSALFFVVFILVYAKGLYKYLDCLFVFILFFCLLVKIEPSILNLVGDVMYAVTNNERAKMWASFTTGLGFYACVFLHGFLLLILRQQINQFSRLQSFSSERRIDFYMTMYRCLQLLSLAMPLYLLSTEFLRLFRSLFIVYYVVIAIGLDEINSATTTRDYKYIYGIEAALFVAAYVFVFNPMGITYAYLSAVY